MANVEIYTRAWCTYCKAAKRLLSAKGVAFTEYDVEADPARLEDMLARANGRRSVPQIFIDGAHMGGSDDIHALDAAGKLDPLLG